MQGMRPLGQLEYPSRIHREVGMHVCACILPIPEDQLHVCQKHICKVAVSLFMCPMQLACEIPFLPLFSESHRRRALVSSCCAIFVYALRVLPVFAQVSFQSIKGCRNSTEINLWQYEFKTTTFFFFYAKVLHSSLLACPMQLVRGSLHCCKFGKVVSP